MSEVFCKNCNEGDLLEIDSSDEPIIVTCGSCNYVSTFYEADL